MNALSRNVLLAGLALVVAGLVFGFVFGFYADHEARLVAYDAYEPTFEAVMRKETASAWQAELEQANIASRTQRYAATVHTHGVNMGMLLILVGLLTPLLGQLLRQSRLLLWAIGSAAWIYPLGLLLKFAGLTRSGEAMAALGAALAIAAMLWLLVSISRALDSLAQS